jgi:hypothetical protein
MSTRSQIDFVENWKDKEGKEHTDRRRVYRHSDGYPEGVVPDLKKFLIWNGGRNGDVEYSAANFIYWSKRTYEDKYLGKTQKWDAAEDMVTDHALRCGFGICETTAFQGDIEYFYEVIFGQKEHIIKVYSANSISWDVPLTMKDMKLLKTVKVKA